MFELIRKKMFIFSGLKGILSIHSWIEYLKQEILYKRSWSFKLRRALLLLMFMGLNKGINGILQKHFFIILDYTARGRQVPMARLTFTTT